MVSHSLLGVCEGGEGAWGDKGEGKGKERGGRGEEWVERGEADWGVDIGKGV